MPETIATPPPPPPPPSPPQLLRPQQSRAGPPKQSRSRSGPARRRVQTYIIDEPDKLIWHSENNHMFFLLHDIERPCIAVLPCVTVRSLADLTAEDLHSFWSDIMHFTRSHIAASRQVLVHPNDWRISPRVHAKISLTTQDAERLKAACFTKS
jgi:hypothetical protein